MVAKYTVPSILIGMIILSMFITGSMIFYADVVTNYDVQNTKNYTSMSKLIELDSQVSDISETMQNTSVDPNAIDYTSGVGRGIWRSVWLIFDSVNIAQTMGDEAITESGLPIGVWFLGGVIAIFALIVIGALITLVTKTG